MQRYRTYSYSLPLNYQSLTSGKVASAEELLNLPATFDVSLEVMFRRIHKLGLVAEEAFAAALVDRNQSGAGVIQAACYGSCYVT